MVEIQKSTVPVVHSRGEKASWLVLKGICYLCEFQPESQTHGPKSLIIFTWWIWSHLSGVNHKPKRNHHHTNQILKPICLAYASVRGSTRDRWHAEMIIEGGFNKRVINKSVGRSRIPIQKSTDLGASKSCFISTCRSERMKEFRRRNHLEKELQSSVKGLELSKLILQGKSCKN